MIFHSYVNVYQRVPSGYDSQFAMEKKYHAIKFGFYHLFRLGPSIPWRNVSHIQRVNPMKTIAPMVGFSMDIVPINQ